MIDNKIAGTITKISKTAEQNNSETVTNEHDKEIPKEKRHKTIDDLRLIYQHYNEIPKNNKIGRQYTKSTI